MTTKKKEVKKPKSPGRKVMMVDTGVKLFRKPLYFEKVSGGLRLGLDNEVKDPLEFIADLSKSNRRKVRKGLVANGFEGVMQLTLFPNVSEVA